MCPQLGFNMNMSQMSHPNVQVNREIVVVYCYCAGSGGGLTRGKQISSCLIHALEGWQLHKYVMTFQSIIIHIVLDN